MNNYVHDEGANHVIIINILLVLKLHMCRASIYIRGFVM